MNTDAFSTLYDLMEQRLRKQTINFREPLDPELKLAFVLWFLGHGGNVKQAALMFHIGTSTAYQLLKDICVNLVHVLNPLYVPKPTRAKWIEIANLYEQLLNFPNCIGALDGKHIDIEQPASAGSSLNDASVFSDTDFASQLANDELDIPPSRPLPNTDIEMPFMFIADEIFALSKHLMKSFSKSGELRVEEKKLKFDLTTSHFIVAAIICLHNFLITSAEYNMDDVNEEVVEGNNQNEENQNL
ncbi:uncharacterized protein LOC100678195 [Nasonia vitripennis]|uniref:DDE Tnp4 domain-containing protein n=1 Tax=Nasonia vitripennis TaxID=7425 RepID=A0A7M7J547_NASVI|nr:uncharacterized protein LOC100678195 [Nasonia vitripennis]